MSKVTGAKILNEWDAVTAAQAKPEIYVTITKDGDEAYRSTYDTKEDAVDNGDHNGELVLTYKLVKVEELALKRSTMTVPVKIPVAS